MERDVFLTTLHTACKDLLYYFTGRSREWITGIIVDGKDDEKQLDIDRVYELLCYFSLLSSLPTKVVLVYKEGVSSQGFRLPYAPGKKKNYAFFRFSHGDKTYDLCCGTGVPGKDGHDQHPDISLQRMPSKTSEAEPGTLVALWDAKYHEKYASKDDVYQISFWSRDLDLEPYSKNDVLEEIMPKQYQVTAIVTNAKQNENVIYKKQSLENGFSFVFDYKGPNTGDGPIPSREEHLVSKQKEVK